MIAVMDVNNYIWPEKYRPSKIADCVLPEHLKARFTEIAKSGDIPHLLLHGRAGVGKTTVAIALCQEVGADYILINASKDGNIDTLRTTIQDFASSMSFHGSRKVVILDEADYLNPNSTQPALRGAITEYSSNCTFIFTCNNKSRLIEPLHSRSTVIEFSIPKEEKPSIARQIASRIRYILETEGVEYDKNIVNEIIMRFFPDFRRMLNELQTYAIGGKIDVGILAVAKDVTVDEVVKYLKDKNFKEMRKWVALNIESDPIQIYRRIYDCLNDYMKPESVPEAVLILAEAMYRAAFVADQEIQMVATLTSIMTECTFK